MIELEMNAGILRLSLSNPPANALSIAMLNALSAQLSAVAADPSILVVILAAKGKLFCAGHDLKEMTGARQNADRGRAFFDQTMQQCAKVMQQIVMLPQPVIAEVDGLATAAGCQLVASCDLAVASDRARFCTPGVNIGLFCSTPMVALSRNATPKHAMEMLLTGEEVSADHALRIGLINHVVAPDALAETTEKLAARIASKSRLTLKIGKQAFYRQAEMSLAEAYDYCAQVMVENMMARDAEEGIGAFLEKRAPEWKGE